ncbi:nuclease-related domain-containing protein [uncultured Bacteroides sp.]|uniref:nuclease-related domain-containing protein n=1 Tax=uncultured Bacteroides sp. TaxID=162156 RepID=UPI002620DCBA|nr:nuclease-related domain-containing protein [uncultured Bacteroides sp.]
MSLAPIIFLLCLIFWVVYFLYVKHKERKLIELVTPITRGEWSERRVILKLLKDGINPKAIFHDLYIQKPNGEYTQVDVAVATKTGIIVFEVKDYSGWIFGNEHQRYWTQILAYGKEKHRFYNPVNIGIDRFKLCHESITVFRRDFNRSIAFQHRAVC